MICNKYELLEKIGQGTFSQIFKGRNIRTGELIAIKIEPKTASIKLLQNETRIYKYLNEIEGVRIRIPTMKWFGVDNTNYYMVISLLGKSVESFKREQPSGRVSLSSVLNIGIQMIHLLESIHKAQLIHRDVKPDNFLFKKEQLYIIDFGFCTKYKRTVPTSKSSNLIGTPKFASIAGHEFAELSQCDDLESVGYILIYLFMGELEWNHISDNDTIKMMKMRIAENTEIPCVFIDYLQNVKNMDYAKLISIFNT
jgi:casein kinase 1